MFSNNVKKSNGNVITTIAALVVVTTNIITITIISMVRTKTVIMIVLRIIPVCGTSITDGNNTIPITEIVTQIVDSPER